jgi:ATP-dependent protease ClpP protease subunit
MALCEVDMNTVTVTMDEDAREIYLFGAVDIEVASQVVVALRQLDRVGRGNITLIISSGGGEEGAGWTIYDALCLTRSKVIAQCYGECMSIASLILQACDTRLLSPNCRFMVHNGTCAFNGPLEKVRGALQEENFLTLKYYEKLAERSELTIDEVKDLCDNDTYLTAEDTCKNGFADGILGQTKRRKGKK